MSGAPRSPEKPREECCRQCHSRVRCAEYVDGVRERMTKVEAPRNALGRAAARQHPESDADERDAGDSADRETRDRAHARHQLAREGGPCYAGDGELRRIERQSGGDLPTIDGTIEENEGIDRASVMPTTSDSTLTIHGRTSPARRSPTISIEHSIWIDWKSVITRRRSARSASTPPTSVSTQSGALIANASSRTRNATPRGSATATAARLVAPRCLCSMGGLQTRTLQTDGFGGVRGTHETRLSAWAKGGGRR